MIGTGARAFITAAIFSRPDSGFQDGESEKDRLLYWMNICIKFDRILITSLILRNFASLNNNHYRH